MNLTGITNHAIGCMFLMKKQETRLPIEEVQKLQKDIESDK